MFTPAPVLCVEEQISAGTRSEKNVISVSRVHPATLSLESTILCQLHKPKPSYILKHLFTIC